MTAVTEIARLAARQVKEAGEVLGRAFYDDPFYVYFLPNDAKRIRPLAWMLGTWTRYGHLYGEVYTTTDRMDGVAVWLPPESPPMSRERVIRAGMAPMPRKLGPEGYQRLMGMRRHFDELHRRDAPDPHWYLWVLGVDPPRQSQGVGGALLQPVLARADGEGLPCYLETQKERNVPFYQKHGFEVVVEDDLPDGGLHSWTMKRAPRR